MFMGRDFKRASILAAAIWVVFGLGFAGGASAEDEDEPRGWTGEVAASFAAQTGSVDTLAADLDAKTERKWENDLLGGRLTGSYGRTRDRNDSPSEDRTTQNSQAMFLNHRHSFHSRFLWRSGLELSRDPTQDREVRFFLATGPGYLFWEGEDTEKQFFESRIGIGYRYELFDGNTGPDPATGLFDLSLNGYDSNFADAILSMEYRNLFFDGAMEWTHTAGIAMPMNDTDAYLARTEAIIGIPLNEAWSFRTAFLFEYNNNAPDNQNKALTRTTVGLGYKF